MARRQSISTQINRLTASLESRAVKSQRAANRRLEKGQETIAEVAKMYAPEYKGNLGEAIKTTKSKSSIDRRRRTLEIYVDEGAKGSNGAETVGKYAVWIHEDMSYQLGEQSLLKDADVGGNGFGWPRGGKVGPQFLTRAMIDHRSKIERDIKDAIKRELK